MKIVHIVSSDIGGAARAAIRINEGINMNDVDSSVIVMKKGNNSSSETILDSKYKKIKMYLNIVVNNFTLRLKKTDKLFSNELLGFDISKDKRIQEADIINLHWINSGMLSYKSLRKLKMLNKPIVWTLHDMWPFTGGCHYDEECGNYKNICGNCRVMGSEKESDISTKLQRKKKRIFSDMNLTIVGCSKWITKCAEESAVLKKKKCVNIPNCIDIERFKSIPKLEAKRILNIKTNKKVILFGAMSSTADERKGFKYLLEAIKGLDRQKYIAVIFGNKTKNKEIERYLETIYFGQLVDDFTLSLLYSSADVFVAPSKQENLANTVMESLSCGTPVVAFDIGGMKDMIKHEWNGYLAKPFNKDDLRNGIIKCIENNNGFGINAREYVLNNYTYEIIGNRYMNLYKDLINYKG